MSVIASTACAPLVARLRFAGVRLSYSFSMTFSYSPFRFWNRGTTGGSALPVGAGATYDFFGHATSWYIEKLGLQKVPAEMDDPEGCVAFGFSKKDQTCIAVIGPLGKPTDGTTPMLYASSIRRRGRS